MTRFDFTTLGEIMVRFSTPPGERLEMAARLFVHPGGAEGNVANLLARLGRRAAWAGALPDNPLGRLAANHLRVAGVDLSGVVWDVHGRMGTYYVEFSGPPRPIAVTYDRAGSSAAILQPAQMHWDVLLNTRLLHLTGITPALSSSNLEVVRLALSQARSTNIPISFDVNYRSKLWSASEAASTLRHLIAGVNLLFCGQGDAALLFGCHGSPTEMIRRLADQTGAQIVVMSIGDGGALAWDGTELLHEPATPVQVVDRLGAGDALAAGVIHGWLNGDLRTGMRYGSVLAALALSQYGDMVITDQRELDDLLRAQGMGIRR
jgi:2-dehydro-3-deoxygluconokinase